MSLTRRQFGLLALLTLVWGLNWPVMKLGVTDFPPLTFRALSMAFGLPVLGAALLLMKVPFRVERRDWPELFKLTVTNMLVWHVFVILAVRELSSGRAAILGYTMPIFSALWGLALFGQRLSGRQQAGVAAAGVGVALLLWHELGHIAGRPSGALGMLLAAAVWALGTQQLRRTTLHVATLTASFWMTALTTAVMTLLAALWEAPQWRMPPPPALWAIAYNAVGVFGFAHAAWFFLARGLPPVASTISVMLIPVLGTLSGALWLRETLFWQDAAAMLLMAVAIALVLWPSQGRASDQPAESSA